MSLHFRRWSYVRGNNAFVCYFSWSLNFGLANPNHEKMKQHQQNFLDPIQWVSTEVCKSIVIVLEFNSSSITEMFFHYHHRSIIGQTKHWPVYFVIFTFNTVLEFVASLLDSSFIWKSFNLSMVSDTVTTDIEKVS